MAIQTDGDAARRAPLAEKTTVYNGLATVGHSCLMIACPASCLLFTAP